MQQPEVYAPLCEGAEETEISGDEDIKRQHSDSCLLQKIFSLIN